MLLRLAALLGVRPECDPANLRIDVLTCDHRGRHLVEPPLCVDLSREVPGMLATDVVAVTGTPLAVRTNVALADGRS
jgi:hypothetical protein